MKFIRTFVLIIIFLATCAISVLIYQNEQDRKEVKEDLIELSNIKYGLFNVDEWKAILADILTKKIEEFDFSNQNRNQMKLKVSELLKEIIGGMEDRFYEQNSNSISGFLQNSVASFTNAFGRIKQDIPVFTNQIVDFLDDPKNKEAVRLYLIDKLNQHADKTFAKVDYSKRNAILAKYPNGSKNQVLEQLNDSIQNLKKQANYYKVLLVICACLVALYILLSKFITSIEFTVLILTCTLLLFIGITLPMIEIDARVSAIQMIIMGEKIEFMDQVLYFKSKSILEVIYLMISQGAIDLIVVGFLVLLFSILFPFSKIIAALLLTWKQQLNSNKIVAFLVHKTGKWSMADVMVVAIFMAYLGFSGILTEQLHQLDSLSANLEVLTTNHSSLQTGFFAFTAFAILSLLITNKLKSKIESQ